MNRLCKFLDFFSIVDGVSDYATSTLFFYSAADHNADV
jgi:hypothetical protein